MKEKRTYSKPHMLVEAFRPSGYIAACTEKGDYVTYLFTCDASTTGSSTFNAWLETNGIAGLQTLPEDWQEQGIDINTVTNAEYDQCITIGREFKPCMTTHQVTVRKGESIDDVFQPGYIGMGGNNFANFKPVRIWTDGGTTIHATSTLSASEFSKNVS